MLSECSGGFRTEEILFRCQGGLWPTALALQAVPAVKEQTPTGRLMAGERETERHSKRWSVPLLGRAVVPSVEIDQPVLELGPITVGAKITKQV